MIFNKEKKKKRKEKQHWLWLEIQFNYFGLVDGGEFIRGIGNIGGNVRANNFENGCWIICGNGIVDRRWRSNVSYQSFDGSVGSDVLFPCCKNQ